MNEHVKKIIAEADENFPYDRIEPGFVDWIVMRTASTCAEICATNFVGAVGSHASAHNSAVEKCQQAILSAFVEDQGGR